MDRKDLLIHAQFMTRSSTNLLCNRLAKFVPLRIDAPFDKTTDSYLTGEVNLAKVISPFSKWDTTS